MVCMVKSGLSAAQMIIVRLVHRGPAAAAWAPVQPVALYSVIPSLPLFHSVLSNKGKKPYAFVFIPCFVPKWPQTATTTAEY